MERAGTFGLVRGRHCFVLESTAYKLWELLSNFIKFLKLCMVTERCM